MKTSTAYSSESFSEPIEIMHETSREWLNEISLMKEEIKFLGTLLTRNASHRFPTPESTELTKELNSLNSDVLTFLSKKITEHEMWLTDAIQTDTLSRQKFYREMHDELALEMNNCHKKFRDLKRRIYTLASNDVK